MTTPLSPCCEPQSRHIRFLLLKLGIPVHRVGFRQLTLAIAYYARHDHPGMTKEVYPYVARQLGSADWRSVERAIRAVILDGWNRADPQLRKAFFPGFTECPTNKQFISTLCEFL